VPDYPEMDGVAVDVLFKFFDISHSMYYKLKGNLKAAMEVEVEKNLTLKKDLTDI
jgi:ACT domain-containing protein